MQRYSISINTSLPPFYPYLCVSVDRHIALNQEWEKSIVIDIDILYFFVIEKTLLFWVVIEYPLFFTFFLQNRFSLLFILQYKQICDFDSFSSNFLSTSVKLYRQ